jgi:hypothetical protein
MYFRAFMDWRTRLITAGAVLLLLAIPALLLSRPVFGSIVVIVAALNALVCLVCFLWAPRGYTVAPRQIQIHRPVGKFVIPLVSVQSVRRAEPADSKGLLRTFGNGGLFGIYGYFNSPRLGAHRWFATSTTNLVIVTVQDTPYVLSPDDPGRFLEALANREK